MEIPYLKQDSTASNDDSSLEDPLNPNVLPFEVALHILDFIPPCELIRSCMMVSRSWYGFLSHFSFWKRRMNRAGNYHHSLDLMEDIAWPKLCFYSIYEPNMIKTVGPDGKLGLHKWERSSDDWENFNSPNRRVTGYDQWRVENCAEFSKPHHRQLLRENAGCLQNYVTSYYWSCREQTIELSEFGLSDDLMDKIQPGILTSEWFSANWDCGSVYNIRVELLGADKERIKLFKDSRRTNQWEGGQLGWRKISHVFRDYGPGVRYVRFADAGKDTQYWSGYYGAKMAAACVRIVWDQS